MKALLEAWSGVGAVDHHCHPLWRLSRAVTALDLRSLFTEAIDPSIAADHVPATVSYRDALRRLAAELKCAATEDAILEARGRGDAAAYANQLMERSGTGALLLDTGFASGDMLELPEHASVIHLPQYEIVRLETLAEPLVVKTRTAAAWFTAARSLLRDARRGGAVGVKTIAAYRAGLRLQAFDPAEVEADYQILRHRAERGEPVRLRGAPLVHSLLFQAAEECRELGLPLQVHCGMGDPDEDLADCSPLGLRPLLTDRRFEGLQIVLLHCYPYHREAAYLCSVHPGVSMDLSLALPHAGLDGARALREALGLCPWTKLLYASDASRLPEYFFVAAAVHREALAAAFAEFVDRGTLTRAEAIQAGMEILGGNARRLYRLPA